MAVAPLSLWSSMYVYGCSLGFHRDMVPTVGMQSHRKLPSVIPRAALAEAGLASSTAEDGKYAIQLIRGGGGGFSRDRAEDMQAEAKAMARSTNASVYSPQLLSLRYGSRPVKALRRALEIVIALGTFAFKLLLDERSGQLDQNKRMRAKELRKVFTNLGPTFVKLGQGLSTRPDLCPPEFLEELSQLQDALPTFPDEEAFVCIERELGLSLDSIFSSISPSPIAAASLGQVYKARLKYSGRVVAVKVQRPGIEESIGLDFYLIRGLGVLINKYVDFITSDVVALIDEFARRVYQELNYVQGGTKLCEEYPRLFFLAVAKEASVGEFVEDRGSTVVWTSIFHRLCRKIEMPKVVSHLEDLERVPFHQAEEDMMVWGPSTSSAFTTKSFLQTLSSGTLEERKVVEDKESATSGSFYAASPAR